MNNDLSNKISKLAGRLKNGSLAASVLHSAMVALMALLDAPWAGFWALAMSWFFVGLGFGAISNAFKVKSTDSHTAILFAGEPAHGTTKRFDPQDVQPLPDEGFSPGQIWDVRYVSDLRHRTGYLNEPGMHEVYEANEGKLYFRRLEDDGAAGSMPVDSALIESKTLFSVPITGVQR